MTLIKTSLLSGIATVVKIINGFLVTKIIALYIGPAGMGFIGQFQTFVAVIMDLATGAITGGVVKYTAEFRDDETEKQKVWSTTLRISTIATLLISVILILFHRPLSELFFKTDEYASIFLVFACTLILFVFNNQLLSILNGQKEIKKLISVKIASSFVSLGLTGTLAYFFGLYGALLSNVVGQSIVFVVTLTFVLKSEWFKLRLFTQKIDPVYVKKLGKFAAMAVVSTVALPVSRIIVRDYLGESISWESVGYWEGVWRISSVYLSLITVSLSIYYLPRLSEIKDSGELKRELFYGYKVILPLVITMAGVIYLLRDFAIVALFTKEFMPMSDLFLFQLTGDVIKIAGWLLSYVMIAKAMARKFIFTEILFSVTFIVLNILFINIFGLVGVTYAYALSYTLYLIMMAWIFRNLLKGTR
jgi:PST family polysaccharide transporter